MSRKSDLRKLKRYEQELFDGTSDVNYINRNIDNLQDEFNDLVNSNNISGIINKMSRMIEPSLESDNDICDASNYLKREIAALEREIKAEEKLKKATAEAKAVLNGI